MHLDGADNHFPTIFDPVEHRIFVLQQQSPRDSESAALESKDTDYDP